jgi:hypothetical protein
MLKRAFLLLTLGAVFYVASPAEAFVGCSLYEHAQWFGNEFRIGRNYQFSYVGDNFNDQASAASVPNGCRLVIYEHANFLGAVRVLGPRDYASLGDPWNDVVSSVRCLCP